MTIALFAGSFDPFTIGHKDIVDRALPLFDKIIIGFGQNILKSDKTMQYAIKEQITKIASIYKSEPKIEVVAYKGLTVEFAKKNGVNCLLRSVRNSQDFDYEQNMSEINKQLSGIETFVMFSTPKLAYVSSSMVKELLANGKDISRFIP